MTRGPTDSAAARVRRDYDRLAADYERRWSRYIAITTRQTAARLALAPGERLLDVGCGTGVLLRTLLQGTSGAAGAAGAAGVAPGLLAGVDLSPAMLAVARAALPPAVQLVAGDATRLPLRSARFDVVVSDSSFHYWPDPAAGLREIRRVLAPGGRLVLTDWCDDFLVCRLCDRVLRLVDRSPHRIYGQAECRRLLEAARYADVRIETYRVSWLWGMMTATARALASSPAGG